MLRTAAAATAAVERLLSVTMDAGGAPKSSFNKMGCNKLAGVDRVDRFVNPPGLSVNAIVPG